MLTEVGAFRFGRRLRRALSERYEADALPRRWRFVTNLPTGPLGKRSTDAVARLFEDNRLIAGTARPHDPEIRAVRREADGADFDLFIPSDIAYVDGHFPDAPIVPGVALVHWAVKFAAQHLDFPLETAQAFQVKFRRLILPGIAITLSLRRGRKSETLLFQYTLAKQILSSGSILMGDV
jgi:3-hydroxymyristoyl/3-hydroxydecanoyl-(acyl carrier protein) dehydratase